MSKFVYRLINLPAKQRGDAKERPAVSALHAQSDGSLLCGLSFSHPLLLKITPENNAECKIEDLKLDELLDESAFAVSHGLRGTTGGDTAFAVLHVGALPSFASGMFGGNPLHKSGEDLRQLLLKESGGAFGAHVRHSVIQMIENELSVRRLKEPGALLDVAQIGAHIFGLTGSEIWREPYLHSEKRETIRNDLKGNWAIHRDDIEMFWFLNQKNRLVRMKQTDIKAIPTPLKSPEGLDVANASITVSAPMPFDSWVYAISMPSKTLFRMRRNPVSHEEELQVVRTFEDQPTAMLIRTLATKENEKAQAQIVLVTSSQLGVKFWSAISQQTEDPEESGALPQFEALGNISEIKALGSLTVDAKGILWGGEGYLGWGDTQKEAPRLIRIEL